jgi:hypothetical protein
MRIIAKHRWNPVGLFGIAVAVIPFALTGRTKGIVLAVVVWIVVTPLLIRWWRVRKRPGRPFHTV